MPFTISCNGGQPKKFRFSPGTKELVIERAISAAFQKPVGTFSIRQGEVYSGFDALEGDWELVLVPREWESLRLKKCGTSFFG